MAIELCTMHPRLDRDMLLTAALVHDLGKTREFTYGAEIGRTREGELLGHVELGLRLIASRVPRQLGAERRLELEHCVLCHHGADQAPGARFGSAEALALYRLNALDASVKGAVEHGLAPVTGLTVLSSGAFPVPIQTAMGDSAMPTIASQREREAREAVERPEQLTGEPAAQGASQTAEGAPQSAEGASGSAEPPAEHAPQGPDETGGGPDDRRAASRHHGRGGDAGLYPPKNPGRSTRMIGEVVVDLGFADAETVEEAVTAARAQGRPTGLVLVERGILRHDQLARVVAERFGLDFVDLSVYDLDMGAVNLISVEAAKRYQAVPVGYTDDGALVLAMANPTNVLTIDDIGMMTGRRIRPAAASVEDLQPAAPAPRAHGRVDRRPRRGGAEEGEEGAASLLVDEADNDAPIIKLVHSIVAQAIQQGASDIHVNPEEGDTRVLFRVDGVLAPAATVKRKMAAGVVSRIKILADLDISERRVPQDGRFALTVDGRRVDIRVVTLPTGLRRGRRAAHPRQERRRRRPRVARHAAR